MVEAPDLAPLENALRRLLGIGVDAFVLHELEHAYQAPVVRGKACGEAAALRELHAGKGRLEGTAVVLVPLVVFFFGPQQLPHPPNNSTRSEVANAERGKSRLHVPPSPYLHRRPALQLDHRR